ncbi:MAG TPA: hypothetical protein VHC70_08625 [Phycisphaerales bacterium]|nr:hypothetical protein [Phycisphaerales bacterium]
MPANRITLVSSVMLGFVIALGGCAGSKSNESEAECKAVKPGVVTTPNKVCVVNNDDPVNPSVVPVVWRGQKYGLCCNGCRGRWNAMSDAQKDEAVARAVALSK